MKKIILSLLIAVVGYTAQAQELTSFEKNGKWGFKDTTGNVAIPAKYDKTYDFSEGLAQVKVGKKWGFIDSTGKEITAIKYNYTAEFEYGVAWVKFNGKYGLIDKTGKEIVSPIYKEIDGFFDDKTAFVCISCKDDYEGFFTINTKGECVKDCENAPKDHLRVKKN